MSFVENLIKRFKLHKSNSHYKLIATIFFNCVLRTEPEIEAYINPFVSAYINNSMEQLQGQIDGARISIARLSSPPLYHVLSGNDFTLEYK